MCDQKKTNPEAYLDAVRGSLIGGAVGDALGYAVEFVDEAYIFNKYGPSGIQSYERNKWSGKAVISDDTQMTLFTAVGLLYANTMALVNGREDRPYLSVEKAYQDWLLTQEYGYDEARLLPGEKKRRISWLLDVPELFAARAPGLTCLAALRSGISGDDYIKHPRNHSKGCGGVMRVAPVALAYPAVSTERLDEEAAYVAAITHGHSLGWLPAAVMVHIIHRLVFGSDGLSLRQLTVEARNTVRRMYAHDGSIGDMCAILDLAIELSENGDDDLTNIHRLGEGWVAEEALAIALYCCLRHPDDFDAAIIASVNHKGDSDSTGAIAGNILGAKLGFSAIDEKWIGDLELKDVILETADDLCRGFRLNDSGSCLDPAWESKYIHASRYSGKV